MQISSLFNPKLVLRGILRRFPLVILAFFSCAFTLFVILNALEQVLFNDIPYIETLREYRHSQELTEIVQKTDNSAEFLHHVVVDIPRYLTIPLINSSIELTPSLSNSTSYYVRGNKGHFIKKSKSNTIIIYLDENWRTTTNLDSLKVDELLFVLSYDYNYIFKIDEILINKPEDFQPKLDEALKPQIILVGEHDRSLIVVTSTLVNSVHR